ELLPVRFRRGLYFPLATRLPCMVQDVVATASIAYIYADGELPRRLNLAILFHGRSPFALRVRSIIGSLTHPAGDRPSHPILCEISTQLRAVDSHGPISSRKASTSRAVR